MIRSSRYWGYTAAVLLVAAVLRTIYLDYGLPEVYEEATPMRQAWGMWHWQGEGLDLNPRFFNYPALTFYIHLLGQFLYYGIGWLTGRFATPNAMRLLYERDPTELVLLARGITMVFGVGTVWAVARLGRQLIGERVGLAAAGILAVLPAHVVSSRTIVVDVPLVFFATLALQAVYDVWRDGGRRAVLRCGVWIGLAAGCKYTGALLLAPFAVAWVLQARRGSVRWTDVFRAPDLYVGAAVSGAVFLLASPYCVLDFQGFWEGFSFERVHMAQGHFGVDSGLVPVAYAQDVARNFGVWLTPFLLLGTGMRLVRMHRALEWLPFMAFVCLYLAIISTWSMHAGHYLLPVFPCLALFAAQGVWDLHGFVSRFRALPGWASAGLLCGLLVLPVGTGTGRRVAANSGPDNRSLARAWVEAHVPPGSLLAMELYTPTLDAKPGEPQKYATVDIPMDSVFPERSAPYYDLRWYADFDYIVISQGVSGRYLADPGRFGKQARFYGALEVGWTIAAAFTEAAGPGVKLFRNPEHTDRRTESILSPALYAELRETEARMASNFLSQLGQGFVRKGWDAKAMDAYTRLAILLPDDPNIQLLMGNLFFSRGKTAEALVAFRKAFERNTEDGFNRDYALGMVHLLSGRLDSAKVVWERLLARDPHSLLVCKNLGSLYWQTGQVDNARRAFLKAIHLAPDNAELYRYLGAALEVQGDSSGARSAYRKAIALDPNDAEAFSSLGELAYLQGDLKTAVEAWSGGLKADNTRASFYINLGAAYYRKGELGQAVEVWESGCRAIPGNPDIPYNLAVLYRNQNQLDRAADVLHQALERTPAPDLYASLGEIYAIRGETTRAVDAYEAALRVDPAREDLRARLQDYRQEMSTKKAP